MVVIFSAVSCWVVRFGGGPFFVREVFWRRVVGWGGWCGQCFGRRGFLVGSLLVGGVLAGSFFFWEVSCWVMCFWWCVFCGASLGGACVWVERVVVGSLLVGSVLVYGCCGGQFFWW